MENAQYQYQREQGTKKTTTNKDCKGMKKVNCTNLDKCKTGTYVKMFNNKYRLVLEYVQEPKKRARHTQDISKC